MAFAPADSLRAPVPPKERPARWPWVCAGGLALGQTAWRWAQPAARFPGDFGLPGGRGRAMLLAVGPEVAAVLAGATVLGVFWLARRLGGARAGVLAAAVFVLARAAGQGAGFGGTDAQTVAMAVLLAGAWRALRFADDPSVGNGLAAGALVGLLPGFSRTGTIGGLAVAAWLVWQARPKRRIWPVLLGIAGPVAAIVATRGPELAATWAAYFRWVREHGRPAWSGAGPELLGRLPDARGGLWLLWAGLGAAGVGALLLNWRRRADGVLLAGVAATMLLFLALGQSAAWPGQYWILPVPFLVAAGAGLIVRTVEQGAPGARLAVGGVVVAQVALGSVVWSAHVSRERRAEVANGHARAFAEKNLAAGGVVIGPASIADGVQAGHKGPFVDARRLGGDRRGAGRFGAPPPGANEERGAQARAGRETTWHDLQVRAHGAPVYWIARSTAAVDRALRGRAGYEVVGEFAAPLSGADRGHGGSGWERRGLPAGNGRAGRAEESAPGPRSDVPPTFTVVRIVFPPE